MSSLEHHREIPEFHSSPPAIGTLGNQGVIWLALVHCYSETYPQLYSSTPVQR